MNAVRIQIAANYQPMEPYTVAAFWYLVVVTVFSVLQAEMERLLAAGERERPETLLSRAMTVMGGGLEGGRPGFTSWRGDGQRTHGAMRRRMQALRTA